MKASVMKTSRCATTRTRSLMLVLCCLLVGSTADGQERPMLSDQMVGREFRYTVQPAIRSPPSAPDSALAQRPRQPQQPRAQRALKSRPRAEHRQPPYRTASDRRRHRHQFATANVALFTEGQALRAYPVGLGRAGLADTHWTLQDRRQREESGLGCSNSIQEEMRRDGKVVQTCVAPGPDNPLGKHWLGLTSAATAFMAPSRRRASINSRTHGCIRLHPDDVRNFLPRSSAVRRCCCSIAGCCWRASSRIFLEVHRDIYGKQAGVEKELRQLVESENLAARVDWRLADDIIHRQQGIAREITKESSPNLDHEAAGPHSRPPLPKQ